MRCSNCERPICPDCMTSTPVGMRCPECARQRTKVRGAGPATDQPVITFILIGICVAAFVGELAGGASTTGSGFGGSKLFVDGALRGSDVANGDYWRIVTAGFLHAGFPHLLFNMLSLWILGSMLEPAVGQLRFALDLLRLRAGRLVRRVDRDSGLADGGRLGRHLRADGRRRGGDAQSRHQPAGERHRPVDRAQPRDHVHGVEHLHRRAHRRVDRRRARRVRAVRPARAASGSRRRWPTCSARGSARRRWSGRSSS